MNAKTKAQCPSSPELKKWLCNSAQAILPEFPGGNAALYILNKFLEKSSTQDSPIENNAWTRVSDDVTQYMEDSLDANSLRDVRGTLTGLHNAFEHCKSSTTGAAKTACLHGLFSSMLLAEGTFKGNTRRTKSLFLKYFDRFSILFNAVTDEFKTSYAAHPPASGTINIDNTVAQRQCGFYHYQCLANLLARDYACRYIHVVLFDITPAPDQQISGYQFPPQFCHEIRAPSRKRKPRSGNDSDVFFHEGKPEGKARALNASSRDRCSPPFGLERRYVAKVYNSKTGQYLWTSASEPACDTATQVRAMKEVCQDGMAMRGRLTRQCRNGIKENFEEGIEDRINKMRDLAGHSRCEMRPLCWLFSRSAVLLGLA